MSGPKKTVKMAGKPLKHAIHCGGCGKFVEFTIPNRTLAMRTFINHRCDYYRVRP